MSNKAERNYKITWTTLDDRIPSKEEFDNWYDRVDAWKEKYANRDWSMDADMSKPNPPNCYRSNND